MIQIIAGQKGKGKTKLLLDKVNAEIKSVHGNIVYLDKSAKHMYELNNKVRLINTAEYSITNCDEFVGFIYGIISQDNDLEQMYLDSFLKIAKLENDDITETLQKLERIGDTYNITFVLSVSVDADELPEDAKSKVIASL
ncbi:twitching motility protein PilT [uncultured Robinsoniella sp.]|uniref:twitching motility protein PilT n=1 Tax=uncultured Robinsoniella sp. TaxID=904190 RepID=UPI00374EBA18